MQKSEFITQFNALLHTKPYTDLLASAAAVKSDPEAIKKFPNLNTLVDGFAQEPATWVANNVTIFELRSEGDDIFSEQSFASAQRAFEEIVARDQKSINNYKTPTILPPGPAKNPTGSQESLSIESNEEVANAKLSRQYARTLTNND